MKLKNISTIEVFCDTKAFSSTVDIMLFLLMVSLSSVVLMPVMLSSGHNAAVQDVAAYKFDEQLLQSLLNSRVEGFEYTAVPSAMSGMVLDPHENSMFICQGSEIFTKEHATRTFADLIAEGMLFSLREEEDGIYHYLYPFGAGYSEATENILKEHLTRRMGGRYNYRLEASWQPVPGCGPSGQIIVGAIPPEKAFRQSALLSVPYTCTVSLSDISSPASDLNFISALSSSQKEHQLCNMFEQCMSLAASNASRSIVEIYYPEENLRKICSEQPNDMIIGDSLMGPPSCDRNTGRNIAIDILGNAVNATANMCSGPSSNVTMLREDHVSLVGNQLRQERTNEIYSYLSGVLSEEVNATVQAMMQTNDSITLFELRDKQLHSIYMHVRPLPAEVTLVIW